MVQITACHNLLQVTHKKDLYAAEALLKEKMNSVTVLHCPNNTTRDQLTTACKQYDIPVTFCDKMDSQSHTANNFIIYLVYNNSELEVKNLEEMISGCKSAINSGGTIVFILHQCEGSDDNALRKQCQKWACDLSKSGICINCITSDDLTNEIAMKTCKIAIDLIYNRNLLYSGQLFYA